jgi:two-component system sensor histidine kinase YesM
VKLSWSLLFRMYLVHKPRSLKKSLTVALLLSTVIPIVLMGIGSYYIIYLILDNKIANGVQSTLHQVRLNIEKTYNNLNYISQQLSNNDLQLFFQSQDVIERYILGQTVFKNLDLVSYTNPDTGLFYYYTPPDNAIFFQNQEAKRNESPEQQPVLAVVKGVTYYGPHPSLSVRNDPVFSLSRPINIPKQSTMKIYVETNYDLYERLLNSDQYGMKVIHVLADRSGTVVFSQDEALFPKGAVMSGNFSRGGYASIKDDYMFREYSNEQGWYIYTIVSKKAFRAEMKSWMLLSSLPILIRNRAFATNSC